MTTFNITNRSKKENTLFVSDIPNELNEDDIKKLFKDYGKIISIVASKDYISKDAKHAFISYRTFDEAEAAIRALNNKAPLNLRVSFDSKKQDAATNKNTNSSTPSSSSSSSSNKKVHDNSSFYQDDPDNITRQKPEKQKVEIQDIQWSVGQKKRLLSAMMKHGCSDYKAVAKEFPEFTKTAVKNMILLMIKKSKATITNEDSHTLTGWKNTELYSEKKPMITKALKYISLFEKHPSPEECANCDFRELYNFLSNATLGKQIFNSSAITHETLWHVVEDINKEVLSLHKKEILQYVIHDVEKIK